MWNQLPYLVRLAIVAVAGVVGIRAGAKYITRKKIFISFAIEDKKVCKLFAGQSCNRNTPFEYVDMSVKGPWSNAWKTQCRERIKACHGIIVLVSKNTIKADGVHWEIKCAKDEGIPVKAIYANNDAKGCRLPKELGDQHIYKWSWSNIDKFVNEFK